MKQIHVPSRSLGCMDVGGGRDCSGFTIDKSQYNVGRMKVWKARKGTTHFSHFGISCQLIGTW